MKNKTTRMLLRRLFRRSIQESETILSPIFKRKSDLLSSTIRFHTSKAAIKGPLKITYLTPENESMVCHVKEGSNLLDIAHAYDIELEGSCSCVLF